jgi:hypothetical protein
MAGLHDSIMHYLSQNYTSEGRSDPLASLCGITHFPAFVPITRGQARVPSITSPE